MALTYLFATGPTSPSRELAPLLTSHAAKVRLIAYAGSQSAATRHVDRLRLHQHGILGTVSGTDVVANALAHAHRLRERPALFVAVETESPDPRGGAAWHVYEVFPPHQSRYVGLVTRTGEGEGYVMFVNQPQGR
ncbi:hypothetical protein [Micromonospora sp. CPCC 206061]|uniref:hypothetical protein n=1 Tax=Micromonospora sp. CPCC 206061 TaxID=3122410 RepID=UPI002FF1662E